MSSTDSGKLFWGEKVVIPNHLCHDVAREFSQFVALLKSQRGKETAHLIGGQRCETCNLWTCGNLRRTLVLFKRDQVTGLLCSLAVESYYDSLQVDLQE